MMEQFLYLLIFHFLFILFCLLLSLVPFHEYWTFEGNTVLKNLFFILNNNNNDISDHSLVVCFVSFDFEFSS